MTSAPAIPGPAAPNVDTPRGLAFALSAYLFWGVLPLYLKLVTHVPPAEVVAHRIIWSVPLAGGLLIVMRRTADLRAVLRDPRALLMGCVTAAVISLNWGVYVWAIASDQTVEAALGYYINPLFSIFLGAVLLDERLSRMQIAAVVLAAIAVLVLTLEQGRLPWVALALTLTWGVYAYFKKQLPIGPNQGFLLEVLILLPFALGYATWAAATGSGHFLGSGRDAALLVGCGVVTALPLIAYANGAKLLRLSTIGILQYIAPTMIFLIAVFVFDEPFGRGRMIAFPIIWAALALYTASMLRQLRAARRTAPAR